MWGARVVGAAHVHVDAAGLGMVHWGLPEMNNQKKIEEGTILIWLLFPAKIKSLIKNDES